MNINSEKVITLLIPMFNEESVLPLFIDKIQEVTDQIHGVKFEFLFIDDGSKDASLSIVKNFATQDERVKFVALSRNFGKERALLAGFDAVNTDAVIVIDADLQDPPTLIPEMIKLWEEGFQDVYAQRISRSGESWLKRTTSSLYYKLLQSVTRVEIQKDTGDFRLLDRICIQALKEFRETERNTKALFSWIGFKKCSIQFDRDPRAAGSSKFNYLKLLNLAIDGVSSFTTSPLRISGILGFVVSLIAFIYLIIILIRTIVFGIDSAGYPSLMIVILFLGGVQLLSLGLIGEYIGRIFNESKGRPSYFIAEKNL